MHFAPAAETLRRHYITSQAEGCTVHTVSCDDVIVMYVDWIYVNKFK